MTNTVVANESNFNEVVLAAEKAVLVDFWAAWCGPCLQVAPVLEQIAEEQAEKLTIVKVDVDANPNLAMEYQITSIPAMKLFVDGKEVKSIIGAHPKASIESSINEFLK